MSLDRILPTPLERRGGQNVIWLKGRKMKSQIWISMLSIKRCVREESARERDRDRQTEGREREKDKHKKRYRYVRYREKEQTEKREKT